MSWIAVGVVGAGAIGSYFAGKSQANAQENIAKSQQSMAQQVLEQQKADRERALGMAQPSIEEMSMIGKQLQLSEANLAAQLSSIDNDRQLLNSVDPALKEAGNQALQLLQGKEAASLGPLRAERERQRQALSSSLRDQLGTGYATSSAGIEALNRFDQEGAALEQSAQQQTLGAFLGLSAQIRPDIGGETNRAYQSTSAIQSVALAGQQNIAGRQVNAFNQSPVNYQNVINTAGAGYIGDLGNAQTMGNLFGNMSQIGGAMFGQSMQHATFDKYLPRNDVSGTINISGGNLGGYFSGAAPTPQGSGPSLFR